MEFKSRRVMRTTAGLLAIPILLLGCRSGADLQSSESFPNSAVETNRHESGLLDVDRMVELLKELAILRAVEGFTLDVYSESEDPDMPAAEEFLITLGKLPTDPAERARLDQFVAEDAPRFQALDAILTDQRHPIGLDILDVSQILIVRCAYGAEAQPADAWRAWEALVRLSAGAHSHTLINSVAMSGLRFHIVMAGREISVRLGTAEARRRIWSELPVAYQPLDLAGELAFYTKNIEAQAKSLDLNELQLGMFGENRDSIEFMIESHPAPLDTRETAQRTGRWLAEARDVFAGSTPWMGLTPDPEVEALLQAWPSEIESEEARQEVKRRLAKVHNPLGRLLGTSMKGAIEFCLAQQVDQLKRHRMFRIELALLEYRDTRGTFPAKLEELTAAGLALTLQPEELIDPTHGGRFHFNSDHGALVSTSRPIDSLPDGFEDGESKGGDESGLSFDTVFVGQL